MLNLKLVSALFIFFIFINISFANTYSLRVDRVGFYKEDDNSQSEIFAAGANSLFQIEKEDDNSYTISFISVETITKEIIRNYQKLYTVDALPPIKYVTTKGTFFKITKNILQKHHFTLISGLNHGILVVPFKLRLNDGALTAGSSLGYFLGYKQTWLFGMQSTLLGTLGLSAIQTQDVNSKEPDNKLGFTLSGGLVAEPIKNFQVGIITGFDHLGGTSGKNWAYEDKFWLSVAIGFAFTQ